MKKSADNFNSFDLFSSFDESDCQSHVKYSKHYYHYYCCYDTEFKFNSDYDISLKYQKVKISLLKFSDDYII